ncbi:MAG: MATE family efflux transporter, partial [Planctomycetota bacterium]
AKQTAPPSIENAPDVVSSSEEVSASIGREKTHIVPDMINASTIIWMALPLMGLTVVSMLDKWFGQFVVGAYCEIGDVTTYTVSLRIALLVGIIVTAVNGISFPTFAELHRQKKYDKLRRSAVMSSWLTILIGLPPALALLAVPDWFLWVFEEAGHPASTVLRILAAGQIFNIGTGSVVGLLVMTGNEKTVLIISIVSTVLMIALMFGLTSQFGIVGAAIANATSIALQMISAVIATRYHLGFWPIGLVPAENGPAASEKTDEI